MKNFIFVFAILTLSMRGFSAQNNPKLNNGAAPAPTATVPHPLVPQDPYLTALENIKSPIPSVRLSAIQTLAQNHNPASIAPLTQALSDKDPAVCAAAIHALGLLRVKADAPQIAQLLATSQSSQVRQNAAVALAYLADPAAIPTLISAISDSHQSVRFAAIKTLGSLHANAAVPALIHTLKSPNANIRQTAAAALGQIQSQEASAALAALTNDPDTNVREAAVIALGSTGGKLAIAPLIKALKDKNFSVSLNAARSLSKLGNFEGKNIALKGLKQKDPFLRQEAVTILGMAGGKKALKALQKLSKQEKNPATISLIGFAEAQIKGRLGIKPSPSRKK
jgi:hypothetical protein